MAQQPQPQQHKYRALDPRVFNSAAQSTWINLGLWTTEEGAREVGKLDERAAASAVDATSLEYHDACRRMAVAVAVAAELKPGHRVVDVGCGCGDSLELWKTEFSCGQVVGVNVTEPECALAARRVEGLDGVTVVVGDAIEFVTNGGAQGAQVVLSVDALYHVNTRRRFLQALAGTSCRRFAAIDTFGTADLVSRDELRAFGGSAWRAAARRAPLRTAATWLISALAGIPLENLLYCGASALSVLEEPGVARLVGAKDVTQLVFRPFSEHMSSRGWHAVRRGHFLSGLSLLGAAGFMRIMAASGLVQVCLYAIDFVESPQKQLTRA